MAGLLSGVLSPVSNLLFGDQSSGSDALLRDQMNAIDKMEIPDIEKQKIKLEKLQNVFNYTPEQAQGYLQDQSTLSNYQRAPEIAQAQNNALQALSSLGQTSFTPEDLAALANVQRTTSGQAAAQAAQIQQQQASRGLQNGGDELALKMMASQNAANQGNQAGLNIAAQAQARALQALTNAGQLGTQLESQNFNEAASTAQQQNAINQFNANNQSQLSRENTAARNQAALLAAQNAQQIANSNTGLGNQQEMYNKNLYQQQFNNQMQKQTAKSGAVNSLAQQQNANAAANAAGMSQVLGAGAMIGGAMIGGPAGAIAGGAIGNSAAPKAQVKETYDANGNLTSRNGQEILPGQGFGGAG